MALVLMLLGAGVACDRDGGGGAAERSREADQVRTLTLRVGGTGEFSTRAGQPEGGRGTTFKVTVRSVKYWTESTAPGSTDRPVEGYFLLVELRVENSGRLPGNFGADRLAWVGDSRERIQDASACCVDGVGNSGFSDTFEPGFHLTGTEVFDVPDKGGRLEYPGDWPRLTERPLLVIELPDR
ncbi:DUF4352 domain-containing protein [Streptomyces sp. HC44]|uniref:DUF4352 domain-containing protein n=1 Tax=Streptomyces scabichelini TaxID=2711217 RepID=A0A6G4VGR2_9ACTN|nr:DUF4352 domain-containing protein [Streptomyces scabichelini]NGO13276.1 DUF4352 domain-containing protein [Streptomyces scabichelini]